MKFVNTNCSVFIRTLLFYLPVTVMCVYQVLRYYQNIEPALVRLEQKLKSTKESGLSREDIVRDAAGDAIVIGLVACGSGHVRISEISVVLKSAILFSKHPLKFVIFTDKLKEDIVELLSRWNSSDKFVPLEWDIREPSYPEVTNELS